MWKTLWTMWTPYGIFLYSTENERKMKISLWITPPLLTNPPGHAMVNPLHKRENDMELVYKDDDILDCLKPARVLSTDEPGGVPDLCREALGDPHADVRTVHRLDRVVAGLMVLARNAQAASELSRQIREDEF